MNAALLLVPTLDDDLPQADNRTFAQLLADTTAERWAGRRSEGTLPGQARSGLDALSLCLRPDLLPHTVETRLKACFKYEVTAKHIAAVVRFWKARGLSPHLINRRLVCMSAMGFNVRGNYQRVPKKLKWWLKPDMEEKLRATLSRHDPDFVDYMEWALHTGLRVEETLRLTRSLFSEVTLSDGAIRVEVTVPGSKTDDAVATLLLSTKAEEVYRRRFAPEASPAARFMPYSYKQMQDRWNKYRYIVGAQGIPDATLKAFRRNAARNLHVVAGMPLDLVRQYLRHEDVETTMGYLRLTGGYNTEEYARWL